jgi:hypothetical protein
VGQAPPAEAMMAADERPAMLSTAEVGLLLGYSEDQIRRWCEAGRFDGDEAKGIDGAWRASVGAHWRIPRAAVDLFVEKARAMVRRR